MSSGPTPESPRLHKIRAMVDGLEDGTESPREIIRELLEIAVLAERLVMHQTTACDECTEGEDGAMALAGADELAELKTLLRL